jgi:hypothetical protein
MIYGKSNNLEAKIDICFKVFVMGDFYILMFIRKKCYIGAKH